MLYIEIVNRFTVQTLSVILIATMGYPSLYYRTNAVAFPGSSTSRNSDSDINSNTTAVLAIANRNTNISVESYQSELSSSLASLSSSASSSLPSSSSSTIGLLNSSDTLNSLDSSMDRSSGDTSASVRERSASVNLLELSSTQRSADEFNLILMETENFEKNIQNDQYVAMITTTENTPILDLRQATTTPASIISLRKRIIPTTTLTIGTATTTITKLTKTFATSATKAAPHRQPKQPTTTVSATDAKISNSALRKALTTTHRTYLGMQSNITASKLTSSSSGVSSYSTLLGSVSASVSSSSSSSSSQSSSLGNLRTATGSDGKQLLPKPQKTDAPMLNYIFDSFSTANKHHHHDQRYGPHFEDIQKEGNVTNITVQAGGNVYLNCRISLLQDKTVSWVKRNPNGEEALELLTVGMHTYSGDIRYTMEFQYPSNWRLKISNARKTDEGTYECQISTHPPRVIQINLHVNAPKVMIVDEYGAPLQEKYYEIDSTLQLSCIVRNVVMSSSVVYWNHGEQILNYDTTRGGVSVKTELMEDGANSTLFIAKINKSDSGNYTCSINSSHEYIIMVHILNGESFAELHHGSSHRLIDDSSKTISLLILLTIFHSITIYCSR